MLAYLRKELQISLPFHCHYHNGYYYIIAHTGVDWEDIFIPRDVTHDFMYSWLACFSGRTICKIFPVIIFSIYYRPIEISLCL